MAVRGSPSLMTRCAVFAVDPGKNQITLLNKIKNHFMQTQLNQYKLYNLLFSGIISLEEYLKALKEIQHGD
jgi:hypothetical protein